MKGIQPAQRRLFQGTREYLSGAGLGPLLIRAAAGSGAVQGAGLLLTFLVGIQLARGLGVEGYGYYGIALAVVTVAGVPGELGLSRLALREVAASTATGDWQRVFGVLRWSDKTCLASSAVVALLVLSGTLIFGSPGSEVATALLWGSPLIPLLALVRIRAASLQGLHCVLLAQLPLMLLYPLFLSLLLLIGLFTFGQLSAAHAMAFNLASAVLILAVAHWWLRSRLPSSKPKQLVHTPRAWLRSSIPMAVTEGVRTVQPQLAILLLGGIASAVEVGLYRTAASIATMIGLPMALASAVATASLGRLHAEKDQRRLQRLTTHVARAQFTGMLLLALPLIFAGELILAFVFGTDFGPAAGPLRLLLAGLIVSSGFGISVQLLQMTHHERRVTRAAGVGLTINGLLLAALTPLYGIYGAAVAVALSWISWNGLAWLDAKRLLGIDASVLRWR